MKLYVLQYQSVMKTKAWLMERIGRLLKNVLMTWTEALMGRHTASTGTSVLQRHWYPWISICIWTAHFPNTAFQSRLILSDHDVNNADTANEQATLKLLIRHNGVTIPPVRSLRYMSELRYAEHSKNYEGQIYQKKGGFGSDWQRGVVMLNGVKVLILLTSSLGFVARPLWGLDYSDFAPSSQASISSKAASFHS